MTSICTTFVMNGQKRPFFCRASFDPRASVGDTYRLYGLVGKVTDVVWALNEDSQGRESQYCRIYLDYVSGSFTAEFPHMPSVPEGGVLKASGGNENKAAKHPHGGVPIDVDGWLL